MQEAVPFNKAEGKKSMGQIHFLELSGNISPKRTNEPALGDWARHGCSALRASHVLENAALCNVHSVQGMCSRAMWGK